MLGNRFSSKNYNGTSAGIGGFFVYVLVVAVSCILIPVLVTAFGHAVVFTAIACVILGMLAMAL